jgi:hypothetical protein
MLHLLNPLGLVALTALLVPAAIHLWRFPQRTVRLGSLKFLEAVARPRLNQWRWRERVLLALRLLLVALLALLLTQPEWRTTPSKPVRWALVAKGVALTGAAKAEWDVLAGKGYEAQTLATADLWSALREADARVAAGSSFVVFASRKLAGLRGERPTLAHATVQWVDVESAKRERWVDAAARSEDGRSVVLTVGISDATSTRFEQVAVPVGTKRVTVDGVELAVPVDVAGTKALKVVVFSAEDRAEDVRAVTAALRAVAAVTGRVITSVVNPPDGALADADWVFVLGKVGPKNEELRGAVERGLNVVRDAGDVAGVERVVAFSVGDLERVSMWRRGPAGTGVVLARDSFGEAVLTRETVGRGQIFHFSGRFEAAWSDWTQSTAFPAWMRGLLIEEKSGELDSVRDQRLVSADQIGPRLGSEGVVIPEVVNLSAVCWWLVVGLFIVERLLSHFWTRRTVEGANL